MLMKCENCGNMYDKTFQVIAANGEAHTFDSFECAISKMAPHCAHCDTRIIGHGLEEKEQIFCCGDCASKALGGYTHMQDRQ